MQKIPNNQEKSVTLPKILNSLQKLLKFDN